MSSRTFNSQNRHKGGRPAVFARSRSRRPRFAALASALLVVVCGGMGLSLLATQQPAHSAQPEVVVQKARSTQEVVGEVLVALREVEAGSALEPWMFTSSTRPASTIHPTMLQTPSEVAGQYARTPIAPGEVITREQLTKVRPTNPITARIPDGYRAVAIRVDAISAVEGWARPGARVDIAWIGSVRGVPAATVLVQNAEVLSTERQVKDSPEAAAGSPVPGTVTLLVSTPDAQKIQLAQTAGTLNLSLRGSDDGGKYAQNSVITMNDLFGFREAPAAAPKGPTVKVRSANGTLEEFQLDQNGKLVPLGKDA